MKYCRTKLPPSIAVVHISITQSDYVLYSLCFELVGCADVCDRNHLVLVDRMEVLVNILDKHTHKLHTHTSVTYKHIGPTQTKSLSLTHTHTHINCNKLHTHIHQSHKHTSMHRNRGRHTHTHALSHTD